MSATFTAVSYIRILIKLAITQSPKLTLALLAFSRPWVLSWWKNNVMMTWWDINVIVSRSDCETLTDIIDNHKWTWTAKARIEFIVMLSEQTLVTNWIFLSLDCYRWVMASKRRQAELQSSIESYGPNTDGGRAKPFSVGYNQRTKRES